MRNTIIARGIDTLVVGYSMKGEISEQYLDLLEISKDLAGNKDFGNGEFPIEIGDDSFIILPFGHKGYEWIIKNDDIQMNVCRSWSEGKIMPEVMVTYRAAFLWREGIQRCTSKVYNIISKLGEIIEEKVSRCDLCCDTREPLPQVALTDRCIQGRMRRKSNYVALSNATGLTPTGYTLGKGAIMARLYDKVQEIQLSKKPWMESVWSKGGWLQKDPVTRVEFQLRRDFLKDFNINSINSLIIALPDIWHYATTKWFTMHEANKSDKRHTRWCISEFWKIIQSTVFMFGERLGILRYHQVKPKADHLLNMTVGCLASIVGMLSPPDNSFTSVKEELWSSLHETIQSPLFDALCRERQFKFATIQ